MADPTSWINIQLIEKHAPGVIVGAVVGVTILLRVIKSGFLVFGDKAKLLTENAVLIAENERLKTELLRLRGKPDK